MSNPPHGFWYEAQIREDRERARTNIPINADCPRCDCRTLWLVSASKAECHACGESFAAIDLELKARDMVKAITEAQSQMHGALRREREAKEEAA